MSKANNKKYNTGCQIPILGLIGSICTTIIGQTIHGSFWWGVVDFTLWPLIWIKWLLSRDVNMSIIKESFNWFLQ